MEARGHPRACTATAVVELWGGDEFKLSAAQLLEKAVGATELASGTAGAAPGPGGSSNIWAKSEGSGGGAMGGAVGAAGGAARGRGGGGDEFKRSVAQLLAEAVLGAIEGAGGAAGATPKPIGSSNIWARSEGSGGGAVIGAVGAADGAACVSGGVAVAGSGK